MQNMSFVKLILNRNKTAALVFLIEAPSGETLAALGCLFNLELGAYGGSGGSEEQAKGIIY